MALSVQEFGAVPDGVTDATDAFNRAILAACPEQPARGTGELRVPPGSYAVTPGLVHFRDGLRLIGEGERSTELLAATTGRGAILGRPFIPIRGANDRIKRVVVAALRIVLRGDGQVGIDLSHCGRSIADACLISPQSAYDENSNQPKTVFVDSVGVRMDVAPDLDSGQAGGQVCEVRDCWIEYMESGVQIKAGHNHRVTRNDIAGGDTPVNIHSPYSKCLSVVGNTLQDCTGYALDYCADDGWIGENYFEPGDGARGAVLIRGGRNNRVGLNHYGHGSGKQPVKDQGTGTRFVPSVN